MIVLVLFLGLVCPFMLVGQEDSSNKKLDQSEKSVLNVDLEEVILPQELLEARKAFKNSQKIQKSIRFVFNANYIEYVFSATHPGVWVKSSNYEIWRRTSDFHSGFVRTPSVQFLLYSPFKLLGSDINSYKHIVSYGEREREVAKNIGVSAASVILGILGGFLDTSNDPIKSSSIGSAIFGGILSTGHHINQAGNLSSEP